MKLSVGMILLGDPHSTLPLFSRELGALASAHAARYLIQGQSLFFGSLKQQVGDSINLLFHSRETT